MSVVFILSGAAVIYCGWRLLFRVSEGKIHRNFFGSSWMYRMSKEDAEGFGMANGALLSAFLLFAGVVLVFIGMARLFGWAGGEG